MQQIEVKRIKSTIAEPQKVKIILTKGLGLTRIGMTRQYKDNNCLRGMINKVKHLVEYKIIS